jgi:hypothetical protein
LLENVDAEQLLEVIVDRALDVLEGGIQEEESFFLLREQDRLFFCVPVEGHIPHDGLVDQHFMAEVVFCQKVHAEVVRHLVL